MKIYCESCRNEILAEDIDIKNKVAKCSECNNIFNISNQLQAVSSAAEEKSSAEIGLPKGMQVKKEDGRLLIIRKWFSPVVIFLTFFCTFWDGFMIVWFYIAITKKEYAMAAFGSLHALVGILLTYALIGGYINKTYIYVTKNYLKIKHGPLPFPGNVEIASAEFKQLYSKEKVSSSRNGTSYSYGLYAVTKAGKNIKLLENLDSSEQALYVEQEIEKFLKIKDSIVRGEISR